MPAERELRVVLPEPLHRQIKVLCAELGITYVSYCELSLLAIREWQLSHPPAPHTEAP